MWPHMLFLVRCVSVWCVCVCVCVCVWVVRSKREQEVGMLRIK